MFLIYFILKYNNYKTKINLEIDGKPEGKIIIGLFGTVVPKTVNNFKSLCKCDKGKGQLSGKSLCFKGTKIHRISE